MKKNESIGRDPGSRFQHGRAKPAFALTERRHAEGLQGRNRVVLGISIDGQILIESV